MTRSHVHLLSESGQSQVDVADRLHVSECSVRRILLEPRPTPAEVREDVRADAAKVGRPSKADDLRPAPTFAGRLKFSRLLHVELTPDRVSLPGVKRVIPHAHLRDLLAAQLGAWLRETNHVRPCRATDELPAVRFERERDRLRTLPAHVAVDRYALREQRVVSASGLVHHEGTADATDPSAVGHTVDLLVGRDTVEVRDAGRVVGRHPRRRKGGVVRSREDRRATVAVLRGRQTGFFKRECLRELGPVAELFDLLQDVGGERLLAALTAGREPSVALVRRALDLEAA